METRGKKICETLKAIRCQIADANGIDYTPRVCNHKGNCSGTCPACEAERSFLEQQLRLKEKAGQVVKIVGLVTGLTTMTAQPLCAQTDETSPEMEVLTWDTHLFDFNGSVRPEEINQIDEMVEFVAENPTKVFLLLGHTDARGNEKFNLKLSQRKADYIKELIKSRLGNQEIHIVTVGLAYYEPRIMYAINEAEHEQNRKVSLEIYVPTYHTGKAGALIEYALCKEFKVAIPQKLEIKFNQLNQRTYDDITMRKDYDELAQKLRALHGIRQE
ncbi:MAG: OmpA family protein [Paludibacteraceae bacterium]|nr:OmpA family protein [Paludibacteraceae bacterium]